ncbi:MAG: hypothetical protein ACR2J9_09240 [Gaiellales bacterium]
MLRTAAITKAIALTSVLVVGAATPALAAEAPPTPTATLGAALPTIADFPSARLSPRATDVVATDADRAPYPCATYEARATMGTRHWAEWTATGLGRRVRVLVFSYGDEQVERAWSRLRTAIAACPGIMPTQTYDGSPAIATQTVLASAPDRIRMDIVARSTTDGSDRAQDRAIVYQRVGDAIQKVQVARTALTRTDRSLVRRIASVAAERYRATRKALAADEAAAPSDPAAVAAGIEAGITDTIATLAPGEAINVSIGDSMVSGEAGRWRGNVGASRNAHLVDAYGESAYWDTPTGESIAGCHRSRGSAIHIPGTVGLNLACSGAKTTSGFVLAQYKPGIDDGYTVPGLDVHLPGQLTLLGEAARRARVKTILLTIGGNDMGFGPVMAGCMAAFAVPWPFDYECSSSRAVSDRLSDASLADVGRKVQGAIERTHATMLAAGYQTGTYELIVQGYPRLIDVPNRYLETYAGRLFGGGCPLYDDDVRYLNGRFAALMHEFAAAAQRASITTGQPVRWVDITDLFAGRELCARDARQVDAIPADEVIAKAERVQMVRVLPPFSPFEPFHPNQLGQQAVQACLRDAMAEPTARTARCEAPLDWSKVDATGLPLVRFAPAP